MPDNSVISWLLLSTQPDPFSDLIKPSLLYKDQWYEKNPQDGF